MRFLLLVLIVFSMTSCYKGHLYVQHEKINRDFLASTHVNTPDPRLKNPPQGQKLSVSWDFPFSIYQEDLTMLLTVRFWNNLQNIYVCKIDKKRGYKSYFFQDATENRDKRILTYKIDVINAKGEIIEEWKHQFWTKLIEIGKEEAKQVAEHPEPDKEVQ